MISALDDFHLFAILSFHDYVSPHMSIIRNKRSQIFEEIFHYVYSIRCSALKKSAKEFNIEQVQLRFVKIIEYQTKFSANK